MHPKFFLSISIFSLNNQSNVCSHDELFYSLNGNEESVRVKNQLTELILVQMEVICMEKFSQIERKCLKPRSCTF